ncbi:MAG: hypothetical protein WBI07_19190 [Mobilitalea sp.]
MWQLMAFRIFALSVLSFLVFMILIFAVGMVTGNRLRKRKKIYDDRQEQVKTKIVIGYLILLGSIITLTFFVIRYWSRGEI